jgi:hypothetical protein
MRSVRTRSWVPTRVLVLLWGGPGRRSREWRGGQGAVWSAVVVFVGEGVELGLQFGDRGGGGLVGQPFLEGLLESLDLAAGGRVVGGGVDLNDV